MKLDIVLYFILDKFDASLQNFTNGIAVEDEIIQESNIAAR